MTCMHDRDEQCFEDCEGCERSRQRMISLVLCIVRPVTIIFMGLVLMIVYNDECVGCPAEIGCIGDSCPQRTVPHFYCDECGDEVDELRELDGEQLCRECLLVRFPLVEVRL